MRIHAGWNALTPHHPLSGGGVAMLKPSDSCAPYFFLGRFIHRECLVMRSSWGAPTGTLTAVDSSVVLSRFASYPVIGPRYANPIAALGRSLLCQG